MSTRLIKVETPSPQEFVAWVLEQGQFCPNNGKELLQAAVIIQELLQAATITQKLQRIAASLQDPQPSEREISAAISLPTPSTFSCAAEAVDVQQARQDRLDELYAQDGRQSPDHPMHGLYSGLVHQQESQP